MDSGPRIKAYKHRDVWHWSCGRCSRVDYRLDFKEIWEPIDKHLRVHRQGIGFGPIR
jgi:hypothetical protein